MSKLIFVNSELRHENCPVDEGLSLSGWLESLPYQGWLLAHAYDGVIWGSLWEGTLKLAERKPKDPWPELRWSTLLDLRVFSEDCELRVWRESERGLKAIVLREAEGQGFAACKTVDYLLAGATQSGESRGDFVVREGRGGERHAPPKGFERLRVRHYYKCDESTGLLREEAQRWLSLI